MGETGEGMGAAMAAAGTAAWPRSRPRRRQEGMGAAMAAAGTAAAAAGPSAGRHALHQQQQRRRRRPIHPFPARMPPDLVVAILKRREDGGGKSRLRVVDPMAGSGTVLAAAVDRGHLATGTDTDPLAVLIAGVWTTPIDRGDVLRRASVALEEAKSDYRARCADDSYPHGSDDETRRFARYWFDPEARRQLASLSAAIRSADGGPIRDALWCAFSRLIIAKQAGASLALDLAHSRPHRAFETAPVLPFAGFESAARRVVDGCIEAGRDGGGGNDNGGGGGHGMAADVRLGDARSLDMKDGSADMVITSPPYLNAIDYMRCSKFSLVWMGHTIGELRRIRAGAIGTEVGMYEEGGAGAEVEGIVSETAGGRAFPRRTRAVLSRYVHDMRLAMRETARVLDGGGGGAAAYVVGENTVRGVFIRNSVIVEALARGAGLEVVAKRQRSLPPCSRYLPPPSARVGDAMGGRIRREVVLEMRKA